jgi:hypothetical protein
VVTYNARAVGEYDRGGGAGDDAPAEADVIFMQGWRSGRVRRVRAGRGRAHMAWAFAPAG